MPKLSSYSQDTTIAVGDRVVGLSSAPGNQSYAIEDVAAFNPYCFRAYNSVATTLTDATIVQISFGTEEYDYNNNFASNAYTAPFAGVYHFDFCFTSSPSATNVREMALIYKNGVEVIRGSSVVHSVTDGAIAISGDLLLAAGDVITFYGFQDSAGGETTLTGSNKTYCSGHLVHKVF